MVQGRPARWKGSIGTQGRPLGELQGFFESQELVLVGIERVYRRNFHLRMLLDLMDEIFPTGLCQSVSPESAFTELTEYFMSRS